MLCQNLFVSGLEGSKKGAGVLIVPLGHAPNDWVISHCPDPSVAPSPQNSMIQGTVPLINGPLGTVQFQTLVKLYVSNL